MEKTWRNFPLPPSANKLYATNFKTRLRFKTKEYASFLKAAKQWVQLNQLAINEARELLSGVQTQGCIEINQIFYFERKSIITKDGRLKRNDTTNRIKALHDVVAEILGLDDSLFVKESSSKAISETGLEYVDITLRPIPRFW